MTTIETHATGTAPAAAGIACVADWVTTTDHKRLGRLYLGAAALAFLGSVAVAALLAYERVNIDRELVDIGALTQLFSIYRFGLTYLVLAPLVVGAALAVVPLQVGARSLAFPRLAAGGFWLWLFGAGTGVFSLVKNGGSGGGDARFVDLFTLSVILVMAGLLAGVGSLATTLFTNRAPGMNMRRMPVFSWSVLVMSLCLVVALPILVGDLIYVFVAHKYPSISALSSNRGLSDWAGFGFTQPTTLLFAIPVLGFLADTAATATRSRLKSRGELFAAIGLVGAAVFATVVQWSVDLRTSFADLSTGEKLKDLLPFALVHLLPLLGVLTAVAIVAKALTQKPKVTAPLVFGLGAGLLMLIATVGNALNHVGDADLVGTVFEEGTWLAVVYAGVMATMGAVNYWGPKWWGKKMPIKSTLPMALVALFGGALASLSMMVAGFADQPGGVFPTVERGADPVVNFPGVDAPTEVFNLIAYAGHILIGIAVLLFVVCTIRTYLTGEAVGDDPWDGVTLEWTTTSPAPTANFAEVHIVQSAEPLLDLKPTRSDA